jgi:hypothetical protein
MENILDVTLERKKLYFFEKTPQGRNAATAAPHFRQWSEDCPLLRGFLQTVPDLQKMQDYAYSGRLVISKTQCGSPFDLQ